MIFSKKKKVLSAVLSLAMIGSMVAAVPFTASADTTTTAPAPGVTYSVHVQSIGNQAAVSDGALAGTVGLSKRLEAIKINLNNAPAGASITYQTQVQSFGWQAPVSNGAQAGTTGLSKRLEAIKITLSGMPGYEVQYQVQGQSYGWQSPVTTTNGTAIASAALAGTVGQAKRLEAIKIKIVPVPVTTVAVTSVAATSASTVAVTFNSAPADTSKVAFTVKGSSGTAVTTTATWNSSNTVATLTSSYSFAPDTYSVDVQNNGTDLGSTNVTLTAQQIAKIEVTSTTLGVAPTTDPSGTPVYGDGYAAYKVLDQYGNDISTSALAQDITWNCSIGNAIGSNGLLTITPFSGSTTPLTYYTTCSINGIDQATGVTATANLTVTTSTGTIGSITLNKLYCSNNSAAQFTAGDITDSFYIDYSAADLSGNSTKNFELINAGLMSSNGLSSSSSDVSVNLVRDPSNTNNALIQVTPTTNTILMNEPVIITVFTANGKSSSIDLTLYKGAVLNKFTMSAAATTVAAGDSHVSIPFTAVDQNGTALTSYSDIQPYVTFSGSLPTSDINLIDNPDGTASLYLDLAGLTITGSSQSFTIQAIVQNSASISNINIVVQQAAIPSTLAVSSSEALPMMETGAYQNLDFGDNFGGLTVDDQYGRAMDMTDQSSASSYYYVKATYVAPAAPAVPSVTIENGKAFGDENIQLEATGASGSGSTTLQYTVWYHPASGSDTQVAGVTPVTQTYTVVKNSDITGITVAKIANMYAIDNSTVTYGAVGDYTNTANVYGTMAGGAQVALNSADIKSVGTDDSGDFTPSAYATGYVTPSVGVTANAYAATSTATSESGNLIVTAVDQNGSIYNYKAPITSTNAGPAAKSVGFNATIDTGSTATAGVYSANTETSVSVNGNNITMSASDFNTHVAGMQIPLYVGTTKSTSWINLYGVDQYGVDDAPFTFYTASVTCAKTNTTPYTASISTSGILTLTKSGSATYTPAGAAGDVITLTGVTSTGLQDSVNITLQ